MRRIIGMVLSVCTVVVVSAFYSCTLCYRKELKPGKIQVPYSRTIIWKNKSVFYDSVTAVWADKTIKYGKEGSKVNNPRILLARFHRQKQLKETNQLLMGMKPWGVSGSSWALNKRGDYDFTCTVLTTILWQFGDKQDMLYPGTLDYLLHVLLVEDGNKFRTTAPGTLGLYPETENHILMTEGSRYLKNRWLAMHGNNDSYYNNVQNGMEAKLMEVLQEMKTKGLYEFNSMPYVGYTITALLNLEAYASDQIRKEARAVLDYMNFCYAVGSYHYQHFPPMRRRYERAQWHELTTDYHSVFFKAWMSFLPDSKTDFRIGRAMAHALMGACMPYRPADRAASLVLNKNNGYFITLGHGKMASPEIYSAGNNYLLSAGGVNRGKKSQIIARPITLFVDDDATKLKDVFHLSGPGTDFMEWNNTGVYRHFACAAGPVSVPEGLHPIEEKENWSIYELGTDLYVVVYSTRNIGLMTVFEDSNAAQILKAVVDKNPDKDRLNTHFQFPQGVGVEYDVNAPKDKWVIKSIDHKEVDRNYDNWPLINGSFN
ncbi:MULTISPECIES: hypothetical protein [unclassified Saccharicrinis]|uniref:hypothetical protein n=1 Tax=unclassified Saccharicrinis TaxID=2646859 RepID=UPI003D3281D2